MTEKLWDRKYKLMAIIKSAKSELAQIDDELFLIDCGNDELWKPVVGWEDRYHVSSNGRIRSLTIPVHGRYGIRTREGKILEPVRCSNGYLAVNFTRGKGRRQFLIHRLVLTAFNGAPPPGQEGCHNNGVRSDNRLSNLRWDTRKNNHLDKIAHGTVQRGENNGSSKLTEAKVRFIRESNLSGEKLAKIIGVGATTIYRVRHRESWAHV